MARRKKKAPTILDLLAEQPNPPPLVRGKRKVRTRWQPSREQDRDLRPRPGGIYVVERNPEDVDTIVVHQTACTFGKAPDQPTRHHRALRVACHNLAFSDGVVVRANPLPWYVNHGNGFNARSLGLEIEGSFPGLLDDPDTPTREDLATHWGDDANITPLTDLLVETACLAIGDLVKRAGEWGAEIRYIVAHRQSSSTRRSDPGEEIWRRVVLGWAVPELGLQTQPALALGRGRKAGRPIPEAWDPDGVGGY